MAFEGNTWYTYLIYSLIAIVAFLGNALVLYIFVTRSYCLKHSYNIFIFSLSVTDIMTSIMLVFSQFLYLPPMPDGVTAREIYCKTIWSGWILFTFGYISIYTCLALTIERWLAVIKPHIYCAVKPVHAIKAVALVWVVGITTNISTIFRVKYHKVKQECSWTPLNIGNKELPWLDFTLQSIIPFSTMVVLYSHIIYSLRRRPFQDVGRGHPLRKITLVAVVACSALIVGWLPSRVSFMLSKFDYINPSGLLHFCLVMLAFSNSCVNPFLYGLHTSEFWGGYKAIFYDFVVSCNGGSTSVKVNQDSNEGRELNLEVHL